MILGIDPGLRGCGVAIADGNEIVKCWYEQSRVKIGTDPEAVKDMCRSIYSRASDFARSAGKQIEHVYVEIMHMRPRSPKPQVLQILTAVSFIICALFWPWPSTAFLPQEWKSTIDADVMTERILGRLSDKELQRIEEKRVSVLHNAVDAAGILLYVLGRL